jgi:diphthamide biosynthesis enzyme Dph1/Dph2-like protein
LGDGNFHFNALQNLKAYKYNLNGNFEEIENIKKPKYDAIFLESKRIGIYVSSKLGQNKIRIAEDIAQKIGHIKKESIILYGNEINNERVLGLRLNLIINTACPRIADDYRNYSLPVIDYKEFLEMYKKYY